MVVCGTRNGRHHFLDLLYGSASIISKVTEPGDTGVYIFLH